MEGASAGAKSLPSEDEVRCMVNGYCKGILYDDAEEKRLLATVAAVLGDEEAEKVRARFAKRDDGI